MAIRPQGQATVEYRDGPTIQRDTYKCGHCQLIMHVKPKQRPEDLGGLCYMCMRPICPRCIVTGKCDPFEEKLLREEAAFDFHRRLQCF